MHVLHNYNHRTCLCINTQSSRNTSLNWRLFAFISYRKPKTSDDNNNNIMQWTRQEMTKKENTCVYKNIAWWIPLYVIWIQYWAYKNIKWWMNFDRKITLLPKTGPSSVRSRDSLLRQNTHRYWNLKHFNLSVWTLLSNRETKIQNTHETIK